MPPLMRMMRSFKGWIAVLLLAALGFAQVSVTIAACQMDRGTMAMEGCEGCDSKQPATDQAVGCVAHCTSDLQLAGSATEMGRAPSLSVIAFVRPAPRVLAARTAPPPGGPPHRILLHSFLI